ncbi:MAG: hypothetical protein LKE40_04930 [Spirochaetia bacterium]|nr:hypothetical protein [Spirochaetia bacterium]
MKRLCTRCGTELVEGYELKGQDKNSLFIQKEGICGLSLNYVKAAVCPQCGKVEIYVDPEKLESNF